MELHGVTGKPYKHPQVRRKVPTFSRPRIDLDGGAGRRVKREWQDMAVNDLEPGDTVAEFGTIEARAVFLEPDEQTPWRIRFYNVHGEWRDYPGEQRVFAFSTEKPRG